MIITIYGLGLIGGSLAIALKNKTDNKVYALNRTKSVLDKAILDGYINGEATTKILEKTDIFIFALFQNAIIEKMEDICKHLKPNAIVTDICGTKKSICKEMSRLSSLYPNLQFIGGHPMAGKEVWGMDNATEDLFVNAYSILVPVVADNKSIDTLKEMYLKLGCKDVVITTPENHDELISYTSQLAHVVSCSYILNPLSQQTEGFSAGSFKDMTRVAKLSSKMWTELFLDNKENLINQIDNLMENLQNIKEAIEKNDDKSLYAILEEGRKAKEESLERSKNKTK